MKKIGKTSHELGLSRVRALPRLRGVAMCFAVALASGAVVFATGCGDDTDIRIDNGDGSGSGDSGSRQRPLDADDDDQEELITAPDPATAAALNVETGEMAQ